MSGGPGELGHDDVAGWIVSEGLNGSGLVALLDGFSERLLASGMPLSRTYLAMATISPDVRAVNVTWTRGAGARLESVEHERFPNAFAGSPLAHLLESGIPRRRWRIGREGGTGGYGVLEDLRAEGHTDYVAEIVAFGASASFAVQGVALTACSDAPSGFTEADVSRLSALTQPFALAVYRIALFDMSLGLLGAYLGRDAGHRVLNGEIRRGVGDRVEAALMIADLSGFTSVAETGGEALVARLGEHLAAMVEPVEAAGGEVLKFMGDAILAGFPLLDGIDRDAACAAALEAGCRAIALNAAVNDRYPGERPLGLDIGLHRGEVFYGNVGAGSRLDFTVIGPAVNEAARLEALCGTLGRPLLMSEPFARACGRPVLSLGHHRLRGVGEPREVFTLPEGPA